MPVKMTFPDGTMVEGEVDEIMALIVQLREAMGLDLSAPDDLDKHK